MSHDNKQAGLESALFKNPYVPRAADFGQTPTADSLPKSTSIPANLPLWALTGGGLGSLIGAVRAEKGKRLRGALRGGAIGTMAGVLGNAGVNAAAGIGDVEMAYHGKPHTEFSTPARIGTVAAPYALGGAGALLGGKMMANVYDKSVQHGEEISRKYHEDKKKKDAMNTKQSAQKFAKVYEASESVEGAKPKVVFESHKKCTPNEFGMRVKEAVKTAEQFSGPTPGVVDYLKTMLATGTVGSGIGALVGAARAPKGKRLRTALGDAAVGGAAGLGFGAGTLGGISTGAAMDAQDNSSGVPAYLGGLGGGLGAVGAGALANKIRNEVEEDYDNNNSPLLNAIAKQGSAREFGQKVAFKVDWNALKTPALGGAALGALAGGVHGLIAPGTDEQGNTRNRFGAMLRGALGGGAIGGLGGAAMGHFAPGMTKKVVGHAQAAMDPVNYQEKMYELQGRPLPPNMQIPPHLRAQYNAVQYGI